MKQHTKVSVKGHIVISDPNTNEVFVDKDNAINFEMMSMAIAWCLSNQKSGGTSYGFIADMVFGNGASSVDATGIITYLPTNVTGTESTLYNPTYNQAISNTNMTVSHTSGNLYSDIIITCLLDYGQPTGQTTVQPSPSVPVFDDDTSTTDTYYTFDELGLRVNDGVNLKLMSHVVFHPVQKSANRQIQVVYTIRIESLTSIL